jgi:hypothetical protein
MRRSLLIFFALGFTALAGPREDWEKIMALDAGPGIEPQSAEEAKQVALTHVGKQERGLRDFLAAYPQDENTFEARLRLARLLALQADLKGEPESPEAGRLVAEAEKLASTDAQRGEVDFALVSRRMRLTRGRRPDPAERKALLRAVQQFVKAHPSDRRAGALLAEVATLFDGDAQMKDQLLREAKAKTKDPGVLEQVADDFKRLAWLGKPLPLRFTGLDGTKVDIKDWRGKPVVLVFFATWSAPSRQVFSSMRTLAEHSGAGFIAVSLDTDAAALAKFLGPPESRPPVGWDGRSWQGPLIQALGINALPTVWFLDKQGVVRTLDPLDAPEELLRQLRR